MFSWLFAIFYKFSAYCAIEISTHGDGGNCLIIQKPGLGLHYFFSHSTEELTILNNIN